jgi:hypothetical protein
MMKYFVCMKPFVREASSDVNNLDYLVKWRLGQLIRTGYTTRKDHVFGVAFESAGLVLHRRYAVASRAHVMTFSIALVGKGDHMSNDRPCSG